MCVFCIQSFTVPFFFFQRILFLETQWPAANVSCFNAVSVLTSQVFFTGFSSKFKTSWCESTKEASDNTDMTNHSSCSTQYFYFLSYFSFWHIYSLLLTLNLSTFSCFNVPCLAGAGNPSSFCSFSSLYASSLLCKIHVSPELPVLNPCLITALSDTR